VGLAVRDLVRKVHIKELAFDGKSPLREPLLPPLCLLL
jgi:hypothetical protein